MFLISSNQIQGALIRNHFIGPTNYNMKLILKRELHFVLKLKRILQKIGDFNQIIINTASRLKNQRIHRHLDLSFKKS